MRLHLTRSRVAVGASVVVLSAWGFGVSAQQPAAGQHGTGTHTHAAAAALKNPVKATPESIAAGKKLFTAQCATCHGETGKGDGKMAASMTEPKPSDLTDATWKHGSTDGEIFTVIKDGSKGTGMRGYASRMKTDDLWNLVNYTRTLASAAKPR
jgi:mono/diheme cytochrome c family protein